MTDVDKLLEGIPTLVRSEFKAYEFLSNTGRFHTNEELADILREYTRPIQVVDACDLH